MHSTRLHYQCTQIPISHNGTVAVVPSLSERLLIQIPQFVGTGANGRSRLAPPALPDERVQTHARVGGSAENGARRRRARVKRRRLTAQEQQLQHSRFSREASNRLHGRRSQWYARWRRTHKQDATCTGAGGIAGHAAPGSVLLARSAVAARVRTWPSCPFHPMPAVCTTPCWSRSTVCW
eukprot:6210444-Pleurochrysis_carterae.AAC.2